MFLFIIVIAAVIIAIIVYLPYASGLTTFEKQEIRAKQAKPIAKEPSQPSYGGYIPPDELYHQQELEESSNSLRGRASAIKEKLNITSNDMPVKIALLDHQNLRKRNQKEKLDTDNNPNNYDYDLDELIEEERDKSVQEQKSDHYKKEVLGKEKEEMV